MYLLWPCSVALKWGTVCITLTMEATVNYINAIYISHLGIQITVPTHHKTRPVSTYNTVMEALITHTLDKFCVKSMTFLRIVLLTMIGLVWWPSSKDPYYHNYNTQYNSSCPLHFSLYSAFPVSLLYRAITSWIQGCIRNEHFLSLIINFLVITRSFPCNQSWLSIFFL